MKNYTLFPEKSVITHFTVDPSTGELIYLQDETNGAGLPAKIAERAAGRLPLSIAHISPRGVGDQVKARCEDVPSIEWVAKASYMKVSRGGRLDGEQKGGGRRAEINGFSRGARMRLMTMLAKIPVDAELPLFLTLTYPDKFPSARESKTNIDRFNKRFRRKFPKAGMIWKLEPQERGAPHYHCLVWGVEVKELRAWVPVNWYQIAGGGDPLHLAWHCGCLGNGNVHCVQAVKSYKGVLAYAAKYIGKTFEVSGWNHCGRFWAVVNPGGIPFGEVQKQELTEQKAVQLMRYQRGFLKSQERKRIDRVKERQVKEAAEVFGPVPAPKKIKLRKIRQYGRSMLTFCDASQWVARLC